MIGISSNCVITVLYVSSISRKLSRSQIQYVLYKVCYNARLSNPKAPTSESWQTRVTGFVSIVCKRHRKKTKSAWKSDEQPGLLSIYVRNIRYPHVIWSAVSSSPRSVKIWLAANWAKPLKLAAAGTVQLTGIQLLLTDQTNNA